MGWAGGALVVLLAAAPPALAQVTPSSYQYGLNLIGAPAAWAAGYTGAGITIAIGDTGIDTTHPAFAGKIDSRSMSFGLFKGVDDPTDLTDLAGHGTSVAGVALGSGSSDAPGVAYNANVVMLRITDLAGGTSISDSVDDFVNSINYFASLRDVLVYNASYGPSVAETGVRVWSTDTIGANEAAAALNAVSQGKIIVAATGNDRIKNPVAGQNPSGLALYPFIQPANATAGVYDDGGNAFNFSSLLGQSGLIIAATAVGADKTIATYANMCGVTASWCVAAPGGNPASFGGTDPETTPGIYTASKGGSYDFTEGTSFAAPTVSGALAVLEQAYPGYDAQDLAHVLFATAENIGGQAADNAVYGYGLIRLDRSIAGPTALTAGATVDVDSQQMTYWSQPLTTAGAFSKTGDGYLVIAGRTTATGDVAVDAGALGVDGTLTLATRLIIEPGATLAGFGWINGDTFVNGTLSAGQLPNYSDLIANNGGTLPADIPLSGTSPGTLTFNGNLTLGATATTRVNVDGDLQVPGGPGTYDKIVVVGGFAANGVLAPVLRGIPGGDNTYSPSLGQQFAVITAQGGISGSFTGLTQPTGLAAGTRFDVLYESTLLDLAVTPAAYGNLAAAGLAETANQKAVGRALDGARPAAGLAMNTAQSGLYAPLYTLAGSAIAPVLEQMSPTIYGDALMTRRDAWYLVSDAIADQLDARRGLRSSAASRSAADPLGRTIWLTGLGQFGNVSSNGAPGYNSMVGGTAGGVDVALTPALTVGTAFGFANQSVSTKNGAAFSGDSFQFELYGSVRQGPAFLDMQAGGGFSEGTATRQQSLYGARASGKTNGAAGGGSVRGGLRLDEGAWLIEPSVSLAGVTLQQGGLAETQGGAVAMSVGSASLGSMQSVAGVRVERRIAIGGNLAVVPSAQLGWLHESLDRRASTTASLLGVPFTVQSAPIGRDAAVLGLRAVLETGAPVAIFASYTGTLNSSSTAQTVSAGLRVAW